MAEGFFQRQLKSIDVFKRMPKDMSQGSMLGFFMTLCCVVLCFILVSNELFEFYSYSVEKTLAVDHKLENSEVIVHVDIVFRRMPCHLLGLDVVDYIGTHRMNLHDKVKKFTIDKNQNIVKEEPYTYPEETVVADFKASLGRNEGCRQKGEFDILLVPGNFHIGFHSFGSYLSRVLNSGVSWEPDFQHHIEHLSFGTEHSKTEWHNYKKTYGLKELNTLEGYDSNQMTPVGPFSFHYKVLIFPTNLISQSKAKFQVYQYRSFWNLAYVENGYNYLLSVDFDLSSIIMQHRLWRKSISELLIHLSGIIGGIVAFVTLLHILLQRTVMKVLYKDSIGKLT